MTAANGLAVDFNYQTWVAIFPEFSGCSPAQGNAWFVRAGMMCANNPSNPAMATTGLLEQLLYLVTSHIGWLSAPRDANGCPSSSGTPPAPIVGRINSASEGSVSVGAEWSGEGSPSQAYWLQTRYGAEYWQMTAAFRTMRYSSRPTVVAGTRYPFVPSTLGPWRR